MSKRFFTPIDLTGTISGTAAPERSIKWSDGEGTLEVGLKGGNVKLAVGQEELALCYNGTGSTLAKGTVVYISGAQGQRPSISKASASSESTSSKTFGIVAEEISNGAEGLVCTSGIVRGVDTSTFTEGQALWLSTTAGLISSTMPTQPNHSVFIGYCIKSNAASGQIFVKIQNGYELQELHNVLITNPTTGQTLKYNSTTGLWENGSISGGVFEVFYQADSPSSPQLGDIWVESDVDVPEYDNISIDVLVPNQSGNSGKYLTTNGSSVSWGTIDLSSYAPLSSPALTGVPTAPTATAATNTTQIATTEFVRTEISNLINGAGPALDTLSELASALGNDANFATTVTNNLAAKAPLASPSFTGTANAERLSVDSTAYIDTITTTVSSASSTEIDSFAQSSFSSCEYLIQIKQGSKITVLKALMTSVDLDIVQYGIVESGGSIPYTITTDSFIPGGGPVTTKLLITITDANTTSATVKVVRTSVV